MLRVASGHCSVLPFLLELSVSAWSGLPPGFHARSYCCAGLAHADDAISREQGAVREERDNSAPREPGPALPFFKLDFNTSVLDSLDSISQMRSPNGVVRRHRCPIVSTTLQRVYYRNGQLREETPFRHGRVNGRARTWYRNGILASESFYRDGLLNGVCRQCSEAGKLLGKYNMVRGTGVQRAWHDNGKPQLELNTVAGRFCGRSRLWLRNGVLLSDKLYLDGKSVTFLRYRAAAKSDPRLPKLRGRLGKSLRDGPQKEAAIHQAFVSGLLAREGVQDAVTWLASGARPRRHLGRFRSEKASRGFLEELCKIVAGRLILPEVYKNKKDEEFADGLLVRLPKDQAPRRAVRRLCQRLSGSGLGSAQPSRDVGENHLYISMT